MPESLESLAKRVEELQDRIDRIEELAMMGAKGKNTSTSSIYTPTRRVPSFPLSGLKPIKGG